ncbi:MAG: VOC family protein [Chloroflexi bacterium]|nr:VOC family protein [Chloroflexota bacterium]
MVGSGLEMALRESTMTGSAPTLLLLHGRGADENDLLPLGEALDDRWRIISVRAPRRLGSGYQWYEIRELGSPEEASYLAALGQLRRFVEQVLAMYPVLGQQVHLLGFSQGAMMAGSLLLTAPHLVASAVLLSGYLPIAKGLPQPTEGVAGKPVFWGHGTADSVLPVALGRQARDFLLGLQVHISYHEYPMEHQISAVEMQQVTAWLQIELQRTLREAEPHREPDEGPPLHPAVTIGRVTLPVTNLQQSVDWYQKTLGFKLKELSGEFAYLGTIGNPDYLIRLSIISSTHVPPAENRPSYQIALRYPARQELARALQRLLRHGVSLEQAIDYGTSEALYIRDPDGHLLELYWNRNEPHGALDFKQLAQAPHPLDTVALLAVAEYS